MRLKNDFWDESAPFSMGVFSFLVGPSRKDQLCWPMQYSAVIELTPSVQRMQIKSVGGGCLWASEYRN